MSTKTGENGSWLKYDETDWSYFIVLDTKLEWSFTEMFVLTLTKCHYICFVSTVIGQNFDQIFFGYLNKDCPTGGTDYAWA